MDHSDPKQFAFVSAAIAFLGSTTVTDPATQAMLGNEFLSELGEEAGRSVAASRLGDLVLRAKLRVGTTPATSDTLRSFNLFGDPSMPLPGTAYGAATASTVGTSSEDDSRGHGFLSCGTVGGGPPGGPPSAGGLAMFALTLLWMYAVTHVRTRSPRPYAHPRSGRARSR